jgi:hypothetical protein
MNARTLQTLSTHAGDSMRVGSDCSVCPYIEDYQKFVTYYGDKNYADKWILAASYYKHTDFETGRGNADFSRFSTYKSGVEEAIAKGTVYMSVFMSVIRAMEDAISDCEKGCKPDACPGSPMNFVDVAVAFYAGSLEGEEGSGNGKFLYNLANRQALNFRTAGETGLEQQGLAYVNIEVIREFKKMQLYIVQGNCTAAKASKVAIVNLMKVPLIQGVLQYAYMRKYANPTLPDNAAKVEVEGATFAAAVTPYVHACSVADAQIIHANMKVGSVAANVSFTAVKAALERNYDCLGVTCAQVGGIWNVDGYSDGAGPCGYTAESESKASSGSGSSSGAAAGATIGALVAVVLLGYLFVRVRAKRRRAKAMSQRRASNIAAVAEIA